MDLKISSTGMVFYKVFGFITIDQTLLFSTCRVHYLQFNKNDVSCLMIHDPVFYIQLFLREFLHVFT
jgi:hypothetical protein